MVPDEVYNFLKPNFPNLRLKTASQIGCNNISFENEISRTSIRQIQTSEELFKNYTRISLQKYASDIG